MAKRISDSKFMRSDPFSFDGEGRPIRTRLDRIFGSKLMPLLNLPHQESCRLPTRMALARSCSARLRRRGRRGRKGKVLAIEAMEAMGLL